MADKGCSFLDVIHYIDKPQLFCTVEDLEHFINTGLSGKAPPDEMASRRLANGVFVQPLDKVRK